MGQQQLLLLALSAIIVGLSIVVGINMFSEGAGQANQDAVVNDVLTIATRAQGWYRKPAQFGGGGRSFNNVDLDTLNFEPINENGSYSITATGGGATAQVVGTGVEDPDGDGTDLTVTVTVGPDTVSTAAITQ